MITPGRVIPELPAIKIVQAGVDIYLSAIPISTLADWKESGRLDVAEWRPQDALSERTQDNYQRQLDTNRSGRIKRYAELPSSGTSLILPIFAQSILLNVRSAPGTRRPKMFFGNGQAGTLRIPTSLQFKIWEVDGQHRIEGLISAYNASNRRFGRYMIPVAILNGLTLGQEAAQFLIINTTQKPVRYDLELRVLSERERDNPSFPALLQILSWDIWELEALEIAKILEKPGRPWHQRIGLPGERRRGLASISEGQFVDTLGAVCSRRHELGASRMESKAEFLKDIWTAIGDHYPGCYAQPSNYILLKTTGVGAIHLVAPLLWDLRAVASNSIVDLVGTLARDKTEDWWRGGGDGAAAFGSGKGAWRRLSEKLAEAAFKLPIDERALAEIRDRDLPPPQDETIDDILDEYRYGSLCSFTRTVLDAAVGESAMGSYGLVAVSQLGGIATVYAGKSTGDLRSRLQNHLNDPSSYMFFFINTTRSEEVAALGEFAIYHITQAAKRINDTHPMVHTCADGTQINCPYC